MKKHTKLLLILRHAKSSWEFVELADHDRPLNNRGKQDALRIGNKLLKDGIVPQLIISSSADRAASTAVKVAKSCGYQGEITVENSLYGSGYTEYLNAVKKKDDRYDIIMLIGHNPHSEQLLEILTGTMNTMPTCTVACVRLSIASWNEIDPQVKGELLNLWRPNALSSND